MSAHVGDWVQIRRTVLEAHQRTGKLPDDTRAVPFVSWSKGFLVGLAADGEPDEGGAQLGDEVAIESVIGRRLTGTLVAVNPGYTHGFGSAYVPELATIAPQALAILAGGAR